MPTTTQTDREAAREQLLALMEQDPRHRVYSLLAHVSRSGLMRIVRLFVARDNEVIEITSLAAKVLNEKIHHEHRGLRVNGYGFSAPHETTEKLARVLYGKSAHLLGINL